MTRALGVDDIVDARAYERERDEFRESIIALKAKRRVAVGPHVTLLFENRQTIRFQIQEMARAEKLITDEAIETELRTYNPLIPEPGHLSATLFIELTSDEALREWLPKLVGIERHIVVRASDGSDARSIPEAAHESHLTRDEITASVHYLQWEFDAELVEAFAQGASIEVDHPNYQYRTELDPTTIAELLSDLRS